MTGLESKECVPCKGGVPALDKPQYSPLLDQLDTGWEVIDDRLLERTFLFQNFVDALEFTNRCGEIAEEQGHHPDIYLTWGKVTLKIYTHKINGLTESDFILAAKCQGPFQLFSDA